MQNVLVPYFYPHKKGLPDLDSAMYWSGVYEDFYKFHRVEYDLEIEIGLYEIKVIFNVKRDE
jgi:hypothetical protein